MFFDGHYYYRSEETVMASTVVTRTGRGGRDVVSFIDERNDTGALASYKLIEVEQARGVWVEGEQAGVRIGRANCCWMRLRSHKHA